jgi:MFS-type transporter involved in bile tolerance (Atg22 family)
MPPDSSQQCDKIDRHTRASFGWIVGSTIAGATLATALFNRYAVVTLSMGRWVHLRNARNTFAGSLVGATVGLLICLVLSRWRASFRHFLDAMLALAVVTWFLWQYSAARAAYELDLLLWS